MVQSASEQLQKARTAFAEKDKAAFDQAIYKIFLSDIECVEAWSLFYRWYGKGRSYDQFKSFIIEKYFSGKDLPQRKIATSEIPTTSALKSSFTLNSDDTIKHLGVDVLPSKSDILSGESREIPKIVNTPQNLAKSVSIHKSRGTFSSVMAGVVYMPYAGFYAVPTIVVGEFLLYFIVQGAIMGKGGGILGMLLGPVVLLILIGILVFVVPFIGTLLYIVLEFLLIISGIVGGVIGLGLGIACGIVYLFTSWASSTISTIACAILGGIAGYIAANWANGLWAKDGNFWSFINYAFLIITGIVGGVLFVAVADDTDIGSHANEKALQNSQKAKSFSPIRLYGKVIDYIKWNTDMGERK